MATPQQALLKHLSDNWSATDISFQSMNVPFDPGKTRTGKTYNDSYIAPEVELVVSNPLEIPISSGRVEERYLFTVRVIVPREAGTQTSEAITASLKTLYDRQSVTESSVTFYFDSIATQRGFVAQENKYFEVPVVLPFRVYI